MVIQENINHNKSDDKWEHTRKNAHILNILIFDTSDESFTTNTRIRHRSSVRNLSSRNHHWYFWTGRTGHSVYWSINKTNSNDPREIQGGRWSIWRSINVVDIPYEDDEFTINCQREYDLETY